jgi:SAM-dependent methyltransferase
VTARTCLGCGGAGLGAAGIPALLRCGTCGFVTADVEPSGAEIRALYGRDYYEGGEYRDYVGERTVAERQARRRLRALLRFTPGEARGTLVEVGCAHGFFLWIAKPAFAHVVGFDVSSVAVDHAVRELGLEAYAEDFTTWPLPGPVDAVCMWDTIEHVTHPDRFIARAAEALRPGGVLAITTGDIGALVARLRGRRWRQIHPPTHLHYFARATLERLLARHGFRVEHVGSEGVYRSVDTMAYIILVLKQHRHGVYAALKRTGLLDWMLYLNLFDIMLVIARRA